jgi:hypothetical protein
MGRYAIKIKKSKSWQPMKQLGIKPIIFYPFRKELVACSYEKGECTLKKP